MVERIDIVVPEARLAAQPAIRARLAATARFQPTDRVPVQINDNAWCALHARGVTFAQFLADPATHLRHHLLNRKWRIEHIDDDTPLPVDGLVVKPDLGALRGLEWPMEVQWLEDQPAKCVHPLTEPEQIDALTVPDPDGGLNALRLRLFHGMRAALADVDVRLNGTPLPLRIEIGQPGGPIPSAFALCGERLLLWCASDPERVDRLMELVTTSHLQAIRWADAIDGIQDRRDAYLGADAGEMLSPAMYRRFVVPHYRRIYESFGGHRSFHNCGQNRHLLPIIRDELGVQTHDVFGSCVDIQALAAQCAGRMLLRGGPAPWLVQDGDPAAIRAKALDYLRALAPQGGYVLTLGGDAAPATTVERYALLVETARDFGDGAWVV